MPIEKMKEFDAFLQGVSLGIVLMMLVYVATHFAPSSIRDSFSGNTGLERNGAVMLIAASVLYALVAIPKWWLEREMKNRGVEL